MGLSGSVPGQELYTTGSGACSLGTSTEPTSAQRAPRAQPPQLLHRLHETWGLLSALRKCRAAWSMLFAGACFTLLSSDASGGAGALASMSMAMPGPGVAGASPLGWEHGGGLR
jgi:hypothetical protein